MSYQFSPFNVYRQSVVKVGKKDSCLYLLSKGFITVDDVGDSEGDRKANEKAVELMITVDSAVSRLMKEKSLTEEEARFKFFGQTIGETTIAPSEKLFDFLSKEEKVDYLCLVNDVTNQRKIATRLLKMRLVYHVDIKHSYDPKDEAITVLATEPIRYDFPSKSVFKVGNTKVTLSKPASIGDEVIHIEPTVDKIPEGVAYLVDDSGDYVVGIDWFFRPYSKQKFGKEKDWDEAATTALLSPIQLTTLFEFYQSEIGSGVPTEGEEKNGLKSEKESDSTNNNSDQNLLVGSTTT